MLVNFMIIGAQKCGTTNLAAQLASHPQICFCKIKEPGYFHQSQAWQAGLTAYHQLYEPKPGQLCGEASTFYTFFPEFRETHLRLHQYNPDLKLIYIVRDPVERVISNYTHNLVRGIDQVAPEQVIFQDAGYINRSRYGVQLRPYLELFPRSQLLLLVFEEYIADQERTLHQVANFLGIAPDGYQAVETVEQHKSVGELYLKHEATRNFAGSPLFRSVREYLPYSLRQLVKRRLSNKVEEKPHFALEVRESIRRLVADDVALVETLLGRPIPAWHKEGLPAKLSSE